MALRTPGLPDAVTRPVVGLAVTFALHALVFVLASAHGGAQKHVPGPPPREQAITLLVLRPPEPEPPAPNPEPAPAVVAAPWPPAPLAVPEISVPVQAAAPRPPATLAAPPAPTAEEWAFAATYTLKNSKGYRYTWGQQVRSMMGAAVEGPDQGMVRFRVEIAPDGSLSRLDTLWSTSAGAERLARQAVSSMPRWPPTPTGRPLVFEKTISFSPFASDGPPLYKDDCLPDPPKHGNAFAWDGKSARVPVQAAPPEKVDPQTLEDCLRQLPKDSVEAETARDQRLMDQWGWGASKLGPVIH